MRKSRVIPVYNTSLLQDATRAVVGNRRVIKPELADCEATQEAYVGFSFTTAVTWAGNAGANNSGAATTTYFESPATLNQSFQGDLRM